MGFLAAALTVVLLAPGCSVLGEFMGAPGQSSPSVSVAKAAPAWVLIKNPRFRSVPSEPEYIWVEEGKIPWTFNRMLFGKGSLIARPEIAVRYGSPPGRGKISALQGGVYAYDGAVARPVANRASRVERQTAGGDLSVVEAPPAPARGHVVFVDTNRIVIDLTAEDGLRPGSLVTLRREKVPIVHPVTGELLGELDEDLGTAKVVEIRERFSVVEIQSLTPGTKIRVKDRVIPR
ncbi:MAG: hypothetical protein ACE5KY_02520 [Candidatus Tectimicrobiota bacterium]